MIRYKVNYGVVRNYELVDLMNVNNYIDFVLETYQSWYGGATHWHHIIPTFMTDLCSSSLIMDAFLNHSDEATYFIINRATTQMGVAEHIKSHELLADVFPTDSVEYIGNAWAVNKLSETWGFKNTLNTNYD
tara:strand:- start:1933 stop:2328 length:396 start_codon:yes stop_codon:yes gene_type:complete